MASLDFIFPNISKYMERVKSQEYWRADVSFRALTWPAESKQHLIRPTTDCRIKNGQLVIIIGIAKRITLRFEYEPCRFDLPLHAHRVDPMQCLCIP